MLFSSSNTLWRKLWVHTFSRTFRLSNWVFDMHIEKDFTFSFKMTARGKQNSSTNCIKVDKFISLIYLKQQLTICGRRCPTSVQCTLTYLLLIVETKKKKKMAEKLANINRIPRHKVNSISTTLREDGNNFFKTQNLPRLL